MSSFVIPKGYFRATSICEVTDLHRWLHPSNGTEPGVLTAPVDAVGMKVEEAEKKWDWAVMVYPHIGHENAPAATISEHTFRPMKFDSLGDRVVVTSGEDPDPGSPLAKMLPELTNAPFPFVRNPESPMQEAQRLVLGDRNAAYGNPKDDYTRTAKIWSGILADKLKCDITPEEAILMMVGVKLSREVHKPKRDNITDAYGYLLCYEWAQSGNKPSSK